MRELLAKTFMHAVRRTREEGMLFVPRAAMRRLAHGSRLCLKHLLPGRGQVRVPVPFMPGKVPSTRPGQDGSIYPGLTLLPRPRPKQLQVVLNQRVTTEPVCRHDVVCFSIIDWSFRYQRPQHIMSQFAERGHRVYYINLAQFLPASTSPGFRIREIKHNVFEVTLAAQRPVDIYGEVIEGANLDAMLASLNELRHDQCMNEVLGYVMIASWGALAQEARARWNWPILYDCMDEWENFPGIKKPIIEMEDRLVRACDQLVVTAQRLHDKWRQYHRPTVLARNAADFAYYDEHCHPNDLLKDVKHPVVGYYGAIADWFDLELMEHVATRRPECTFVLLGGVFDVNVARLKALPNVRLLGQQPYASMPRYLYHFDACLIPFKINPITEATDPVKLYEYLCAGKPVVSVALPEIEPYRDYVHIARDADDFVAKLDVALSENDADLVTRRRELARQHTWEERWHRIAAGLASSRPRASIIVVTYNNLALTRLCLESVLRNTEYANFEIIVVDNQSTDGTPTYLRHLAAHQAHVTPILNAENRGFAGANNQGIAIASGEYLVLLNNDTVVPPGWLSRLLRHLRDPEVGMVGPVSNFVGNEARIGVTYKSWDEMEAFAARYTWSRDGQVIDIPMLAMYCVAMRRETYHRVGPLDEEFGIGLFEDDDYSLRVKHSGLRVLCALDAFVHHFGESSFGKLVKSGQYRKLFEINRRHYEAKWNIKWVPHRVAPLPPHAQKEAS
jgi:GT2 family glycosyltransferase/glycosyltransferase involved in cell wall biosynthesis